MKNQRPSTDPAQRKTTLKWTKDGDLTAVDMARVLERLSKPELKGCDLSCDIDGENKVLIDD